MEINLVRGIEFMDEVTVGTTGIPEIGVLNAIDRNIDGVTSTIIGSCFDDSPRVIEIFAFLNYAPFRPTFLFAEYFSAAC